MANENKAEVIADLKAHLEELATKIKNIAQNVSTRDDIDELVNLLEEESDKAEDFSWAFYLAGETKEEYSDRMGDY